MKRIRIASLIALAITVFATIDLGINLLGSMIPEMNDGIRTFSILHGLFGIFGDNGWSHERFFHAFQTSAWIAFVVFVENIVLVIWDKRG